jgi:hypothetical protein
MMVQKLGAFYTKIPCYFTQLPNPGRQPTKIGDPPSLFSGAAYLKSIRRKMSITVFSLLEALLKALGLLLDLFF